MIITTASGEVLFRGPVRSLHMEFSQDGLSFVEAYEWNPETRQYVTGENNRPIRKIVPIDTNALVGGEVRIEIGPK